MKEVSTNNTRRIVLSIVAGVIAAFIGGLVLFPLVKIIYEKYFNFYLFVKRPPDAWKDDLVIVISLAMWFLISSLIGGFICAIMTPKRGFTHISISAFIFLSLLLLVFGEDLFEERSLSLWLMLCCVPLGYFAGGLVAMYFKRKKRNPEETSSKKEN